MGAQVHDLEVQGTCARHFAIGPTAFFVCGQQITTETSEFGALSIGAVSELNIETHWEADQQKS